MQQDQRRPPSIIALLTLVSTAAMIIAVIIAGHTSNKLKHSVTEELGHSAASLLSSVIFESLYTGMLSGWSHDQMTALTDNLEESSPGIVIHIHRSNVIDDQYGARHGHHHDQDHDALTQRAFDGTPMTDTSKPGQFRSVVPVPFKSGCTGCHQGAERGAVAGVVSISLPTGELDAPVEESLSSLNAAFLISIAAAMLLMLVITGILIVRPVVSISRHLKQVKSEQLNSSHLLAVAVTCKEIAILKNTFNRLLGDMASHHARLSEASNTDPLTGLANRRLFNSELNKELNRAERYGLKFGVVYFDLDRFKPINDNFGHDAGDEILIAVSENVRGVLRKDEVFARIGGDEFMILIPQVSDENSIQLVCDRVRGAVASATTTRDGQTLQVGTSIGKAIYPTDGTSADALTSIADQRMYSDKSKRTGHSEPTFP